MKHIPASNDIWRKLRKIKEVIKNEWMDWTATMFELWGIF